MTQPSRAAKTLEAEQALVATLQKARAEIAKHVEVEEGVRVPRNVLYTVQDALELIDATIEALTSDRDADIDDAIEDLDQ
jgi:hypothetical protein